MHTAGCHLSAALRQDNNTWEYSGLKKCPVMFFFQNISTRAKHLLNSYLINCTVLETTHIQRAFIQQVHCIKVVVLTLHSLGISSIYLDVKHF